MKSRIFILVFSFLHFSIFAQQLIKSDEETISSVEQNLSYLASERLEGRLMGSRGEKLAYEFLIDNFQSLGLTPKGNDGGFLQEFELKKLSYNNAEFKLSKKSYELNLPRINPTTCYPLTRSNVGKIKGKTVWLDHGESADYTDKKGLDGKIFVYKLGIAGEDNKLDSKIDTAIKLGAKAVIIFNDDQSVLEPEFKPFFKPNFCKIPVYFLSHLNKIDVSNFDNASVELNIDTITRSIMGHNVLAYLNNKAPQTIIIGAHYDHLGYNELGGSTYNRTENEPPQIHNGADDNASGTAAIIELAEVIKKAHLNKNNYLFILFSGEEEGLLGSSYFCKNPTIDLTKVNYMINLDMIGRLDKNSNILSVDGVGTSPTWASQLNKINITELNLKTSLSGVGPSDHTSFYNVGIPVLHFYTGIHTDYHKPSDDDNLINYYGEIKVIKFIYNLVYNLDKEPRLAFTKTNDAFANHVGSETSFKVTLGIMPDYAFSGKGVRIERVTEQKPAAKAGLKNGDIITKLGADEVSDMTTYMKILEKHEKGQSVNVVFLREGKEQQALITF